MSRKLIGYESVDGHPTQKYEATYNESDKTEKRISGWRPISSFRLGRQLDYGIQEHQNSCSAG